jgi:recombinational DNA repair protein RecR
MAIDPLNNIGPDELILQTLLNAQPTTQTNEIILPLTQIWKGRPRQCTCQQLQPRSTGSLSASAVSSSIKRLAHGLPIGVDIEYADEITLRGHLRKEGILMVTKEDVEAVLKTIPDPNRGCR